MFKKITFFILSILMLPNMALAAGLYFDPAETLLAPGDNVIFKIKVNNEKECLNAFEVKVLFPKDVLQFKEFSTGESFASLWIERPDSAAADAINQSGEVKLVAGLPGGYCGKIPGDPGESNILGTMVFKLKNKSDIGQWPGQIEMAFAPDTQALLNDGLGTPAKLTLSKSSIKISNRSANQNDEWQKQISQDKIAPETFEIEVNNDPEIYDGKFYIIFSTVDKQSGIDHYEVQELAKEGGGRWDELWKYFRNAFGMKKKDPVWNRSSMPYLLKDQTLNSVIRVKAVDKAGNERIIEYVPQAKVKISMLSVDYIKYHPIRAAVSFILLIAVLGIIWLIIMRRKKDLS